VTQWHVQRLCKSLGYRRWQRQAENGPNYCWSLDGLDKFRQFGIQIYAAIDMYSRKIIWTYCGHSNRSNIYGNWV